MAVKDLTAAQWRSIAKENALALMDARQKLKAMTDNRNACREAARRLLANVHHVARAEYLRLYPEIDG